MDNRSYNRFGWFLAVIAVILVIYLYMRPVPGIPPTSRSPSLPKTQAIDLPWPAAGQSSLGAAGYGIVASHNIQAPAPIGSTAKVITALAVLKQKPIPAGTSGATITLGRSDVELFNRYYTLDGSVSQVSDGEQITELQALQAMLIPSSNNMADSLAIWAFGSVDSYLAYANRMIKDMGLANTIVGDTNGFSDTTTSTADDLVRIGIAAMANPVLASVVGQSSAQVPIAGTISNLNFLLGQDGIVGIKTGNTDKAGGCYLFAAKRVIQDHKITLVGAVLNQPSLVDAIRAAPPLLRASDTGFEQVTAVHKNQILGSYKAPWGPSTQYKAARDLSLFVWKGAGIKIASRPDTIGPKKAGAEVGTVTLSSLQQSTSSKLILSDNLPGPSPLWHLTR